ncbi:hypothetical protein [Corynebacterium sp. p3-SID1056]|uniref:hypothetical protein n=1 Tax=Corynebacterium sp. p3-SID1056 TaxID=2916092 RepID=UPI002882FB21|nr:hypothetical protein [Corynebacterium sp. p3-SID1056]
MSKKVRFQTHDGEQVLVDVCAPLSTLTFPLMELIVITGVAWIAIGWMDVTPGIDPALRNLAVALWALLALWRFVGPLVASRRRRFMLTDRRILARGRRGAVDSIPLEQIHSARRVKGGISVAVYGYDRPLVFDQVGKARAVDKALQKALRGELR